MIHILSIRAATGPVHQTFRLESSRVCVLDADIACQPPCDRLVLIGADTAIQRDHHAQPGFVCAVLAGTVYTVADHHLVTRRDDVIRFPSGDIIEIQRNDIPELHRAGLASPTNERTADKAAHIFQVRLLSLGHGAIAGCKVLLAQKAFSNYDCYPLLAPHLAGTEASGLFEARLGAEEMPGKEVHVFCAAYRADEMDELVQYADHIVFNSPAQLAKFGPAAKAAGKSVGLRINPECSTQDGHAIYDPCAPGSRLGTTRAQWNAAVAANPALPNLLDGLHFHTLCEQDSDALATTLDAVAQKFGDLLPRMQWLNFGGGHHITRPGYDIAMLERCITRAQQRPPDPDGVTEGKSEIIPEKNLTKLLNVSKLFVYLH